MAKKTAKEINGKIFLRDEDNQYAGSQATQGKNVSPSGPIVPESVNLVAEDSLDDDSVERAYAIYLANQERLYDDIRASREADVRRGIAYFEGKVGKERILAQHKRELAILEAGGHVEYTTEIIGNEVEVVIPSIHGGGVAVVRLWFGAASGDAEETANKWIAKSGAYWASFTAEDRAAADESLRQLLSDTARYGSD